MADTTTSDRDTMPAAPTARSLWFGLLGAPATWLVHFLVIWAITEGGCLAGWSRYVIPGFDVITVLLIVSALGALPVVLAAGYVAWHNWQQLPASAEDKDAGTDNRSVYLSRGGVILSALFLALVVIETVPALVLPPCALTGPVG